MDEAVNKGITRRQANDTFANGRLSAFHFG
jgi:hypothetical protein